MIRGRPVLQWRAEKGDEISAGDLRITPISQALLLRLPFGGFVWNRPAWVTVERGGEVRRIWLVDYTRLILWGLGALSLVFGWLALGGGKKGKRR